MGPGLDLHDIDASALKWPRIYGYLCAAQGIFMSNLWAEKNPPDSRIICFMSKWPQKIVRTLYEQIMSKVRTSNSETKERIRWEKICAEIKRNNEKKWIEKQWGKETVKSSSEQERMQYRRRPYSSWAVYEQIMSRLWAGGDTHKTGSGTSSRVDKRKSKTKQRTKRQGDEKIRWAERKKDKTFRCP